MLKELNLLPSTFPLEALQHYAAAHEEQPRALQCQTSASAFAHGTMPRPEIPSPPNVLNPTLLVVDPN